MGRLTEKDVCGHWRLKGLQWKNLYEGTPITRETYEVLYGALCKLLAYEETGLTPEEIEMRTYCTIGTPCEFQSSEIRKDGWIPVERELPPNAKHKGDFCPKYRVMTKFGETYGWYNPDVKSWYVLIWFITDRYLASEIDFDRGDKAKIVRLPDKVNNVEHILIAWKPIEPYLPERSDNYDRK